MRALKEIYVYLYLIITIICLVFFQCIFVATLKKEHLLDYSSDGSLFVHVLSPQHHPDTMKYHPTSVPLT